MSACSEFRGWSLGDSALRRFLPKALRTRLPVFLLSLSLCFFFCFLILFCFFFRFRMCFYSYSSASLCFVLFYSIFSFFVLSFSSASPFFFTFFLSPLLPLLHFPFIFSSTFLTFSFSPLRLYACRFLCFFSPSLTSFLFFLLIQFKDAKNNPWRGDREYSGALGTCFLTFVSSETRSPLSPTSACPLLCLAWCIRSFTCFLVCFHFRIKSTYSRLY